MGLPFHVTNAINSARARFSNQLSSGMHTTVITASYRWTYIKRFHLRPRVCLTRYSQKVSCVNFLLRQKVRGNVFFLNSSYTAGLRVAEIWWDLVFLDELKG